MDGTLLHLCADRCRHDGEYLLFQNQTSSAEWVTLYEIHAGNVDQLHDAGPPQGARRTAG
jgi:hypothetical protein